MKKNRHSKWYRYKTCTVALDKQLTTLTTAVCKILCCNFNILKNDDNTKAIFIQLPLKAYRRARNLRDLLVHSSLPPDQPRQPGTFPCRRTICRSCPFINPTTSISTPEGVIRITGHFTSTSENLIYCISCRKCPTAVYIRENGRRLADRFREHRASTFLTTEGPSRATAFQQRRSHPRGRASGRGESRSSSEGSPTAQTNASHSQRSHAHSSRS